MDKDLRQAEVICNKCLREAAVRFVFLSKILRSDLMRRRKYFKSEQTPGDEELGHKERAGRRAAKEKKHPDTVDDPSGVRWSLLIQSQ